MNKKILTVLIIIIVVPVVWYLISPIFRVKKLNEPSPIVKESVPQVKESVPEERKAPVIKDSFNTLTPETKAQFEIQTNKMKDKVMVMAQPMPSKPSTQVIAQGMFMPRAHEVKGKALLISAEEKKILRFEDFETINGPNLHIYLSSDLGGNDYVDLGAIRATKGNVNYEVPSALDAKKYNKVLVWCVPFSVLFSYADLQ